MMKSQSFLDIRVPRSKSALQLLAFAVAVLMSGGSIVLAETDESALNITAETKLTAEAAEKALRISTYKVESAKRATERLALELGANHPKVARRRSALGVLSNIHTLRQAIIPLLVGERDEEKQVEIKRLVKELNDLTEAYDEQVEQVTMVDAEEKALKAKSEHETAQHAHKLATMTHELELAKRQLALSQNQLMESAQQLAKQERDRALPPLENAELRIFHLKYVPAASAAKAIETLFGAGAMRVAVDDRTNSLILLTKPDSLKVIEALLMNLDEKASDGRDKKQPQPSNAVAKKSLLLRLFWLADGFTVTDAKDPAKVLPASVLRATEKLGLAKPQLVAQTVTSLAVSNNDAAEFSAFIPALFVDQFMGLNYGGKLTLGEANTVALAMHIDTRQGAICELEGSLTMPLGHYMVLGTSDTLLPGVSTKSGATNAAAKRAIVTTDGQSGPSQEAPQQEVSGLPGDDAVPSSPAEPPKPNTVRFAFVVQVDEAESFAPEE